MSKKQPPKTETGLQKRNPGLPKRIKVNTMINYQFTVEELAEKSQELARESINLSQVKKDKKQVMDEFKSKESASESAINLLSMKISNRYEMRRMDVMMQKDFDSGFKIYYDIKTGNELQRDKISSEDYQLDLEEQAAAARENNKE